MPCVRCNAEISITSKTDFCPLCGADLRAAVEAHLAAGEFVHHVLTNEEREQIERLLLEDKRIEAIHLIFRIRRKARFKAKIFAQGRVITIIEQETTNELLRAKVKEAAYREQTLKPQTPPPQTPPRLTQCTACGQQISTQAESCPHCGHPTGVHICPKCGSANTKTISGASKATSIFLWGPFAANKVLSKFQCKNCGHKF